MSTAAIMMMVLTMGTVTAFATYFFVKMLRTPLKDSPSTQSEQLRKE